MAGVAAIDDATRRIQAGTGDVFLVGGACNAERSDSLLNLQLCGLLWKGPRRSVWQRGEHGGGVILGSLGAFLVLESAAHASARGRRPYARIATVRSGNRRRDDDAPFASEVADAMRAWLSQKNAAEPAVILSGASGSSPATGQELAWIEDLSKHGVAPAVRAFGTALGHAVEAQFPTGLVLAALAISKGQFFAPFDSSGIERPCTDAITHIAVTTFGCRRGEGIALLEAIPAQARTDNDRV